jgi:hypothetical protein
VFASLLMKTVEDVGAVGASGTGEAPGHRLLGDAGVDHEDANHGNSPGKRRVDGAHVSEALDPPDVEEHGGGRGVVGVEPDAGEGEAMRRSLIAAGDGCRGWLPGMAAGRKTSGNVKAGPR